MQVEARSMNMWIMSLPIKAFIILFAIAGVLFGVSIVIGAKGPYIWVRQTTTAWNCGYDYTNSVNASLLTFNQSCGGVDLSVNGSVWSYVLSGVGKLNQEIDLTVTPSTTGLSTGTTQTLTWVISVEKSNNGKNWSLYANPKTTKRDVSCSQNKYWCNSQTIVSVPWIGYSAYRFNVSVGLPSGYGDTKFQFQYVNSANTKFELWWRMFFLVTTFADICVFFFFLRKLKFVNWTVEQKWTVILLTALFFYNNPFFPFYIVASGWFPVFLNQLLATTFFAALLVYWLITFDGIRKESQNMNRILFYAPKLGFIGACWVLIIALETWNQLHTLDDPTHSATNTLGGYIFLGIIAVVLMLIYLVWIGYLVFRAFIESKGISYLGPRIKFFGGFTLGVMILFILLVVISFLSQAQIENNAAKFLTTISLANIYITVLVVLFLPVKDAIKFQDNKANVGGEAGSGEDEFPPEHFEQPGDNAMTDVSPADEPKVIN